MPAASKETGYALSAVAVVAVFSSGFLGSRTSNTEDSEDQLPPTGGALLVAIAWIALVALLYAKSRSMEHWSIFLPVMVLASLVGVSGEFFEELTNRIAHAPEGTTQKAPPIPECDPAAFLAPMILLPRRFQF